MTGDYDQLRLYRKGDEVEVRQHRLQCEHTIPFSTNENIFDPIPFSTRNANTGMKTKVCMSMLSGQNCLAHTLAQSENLGCVNKLVGQTQK